MRPNWGGDALGWSAMVGEKGGKGQHGSPGQVGRSTSRRWAQAVKARQNKSSKAPRSVRFALRSVQNA
ncbi:hypothetical protein BC567DRAFT_230759 [Phyllosticta citribraziliensis]